jgi:hypothetical protein
MSRVASHTCGIRGAVRQFACPRVPRAERGWNSLKMTQKNDQEPVPTN